MVKANQDIRQYMEDRGVTQRMLATQMGTSQTTIFKTLSKELPQSKKEDILRHIDAIVADTDYLDEDETPVEKEPPTDEVEEEEEDDVTCSTKFQIGDRVKIPSKSNKIGIINDIWTSLAKASLMYAVADESDGHMGLYAQDQLEPAPLPIDFRFEAHIDGNVAVVTMVATQGEKTWIYARGHAHILHNGEVGMAQAVSYAAKRMFESLDKKQDKQIYFKGDK